ncbi:MAG: hypothetical protein D6830_05015 [Ignavibacteria bacterium]|nr:MAG: hypothetical protein D6830_05015 [Ignavibacteria bacterium]
MVNFLITIDTEEEGLWGGNYLRHQDCTVENIQYLPAFQNFCNELGLKPTYLIDYPVAVNPKAQSILKSLLAQGNCEVGTHLHPWCNPPYEEEINYQNSYVSNLPEELQYKKLKILTEAIEENIGVKPISYRAGKYGFAANTIPILERLGYRIDTSIVPLRNNRRQYEPTFGLVSLNPYFLAYHNIEKKGDSKILEVPITVDFTRSLPKSLKKLYPVLPDMGIRRLLRLVGNIELVWLRPSYASLEDMKKMVDTVLQNGTKVLNMMFHSSELMPGASPYNKTKEDVQNFLNKIRDVFLHARLRKQVQPITLSEIVQRFATI